MNTKGEGNHSRSGAETAWAWQEVLTAACAQWYADRVPEGRQPAPSPEWPPGDELQRLAELPPERRGAFLQLARRRLTAFPFAQVHPGWLLESVPADPLLRHWCLALLPGPVREKLVPLLPRGRRALPAADTTGAQRLATVWIDPVGPPRWLAAWWAGELQARLRYPLPFPWSVRADAPLTWLSTLSNDDLQTLLRRYGLRLVAAGVSRLPHAEVVQWVYRFPAELRDPLIGLVRDRCFPEAEAWTPRLVAMAEDSAPSEIPLHLALVDVAAQAAERRLVAEARRAAYRLPPDLGRELLGAFDEDLGDLTSPADAWDTWVAEDHAALVAARQIAPLDLAEDAA